LHNFTAVGRPASQPTNKLTAETKPQGKTRLGIKLRRAGKVEGTPVDGVSHTVTWQLWKLHLIKWEIVKATVLSHAPWP